MLTAPDLAAGLAAGLPLLASERLGEFFATVVHLFHGFTQEFAASRARRVRPRVLGGRGCLDPPGALALLESWHSATVSSVFAGFTTANVSLVSDAAYSPSM